MRSTRRLGRAVLERLRSAGRNRRLLTLLQVGFTEPPQSPAALVVSYTTVSPLPSGEPDGGLFSVALSRGSPRVGVTHHLALWSPDFPRPMVSHLPRPPGQLARWHRVRRSAGLTAHSLECALVLILLPPSEGKAPTDVGQPFEIGALSLPELTPTRERARTALAKLSSGRESRARQVLGLTPRQTEELDRNRELLDASGLPAGRSTPESSTQPSTTPR